MNKTFFRITVTVLFLSFILNFYLLYEVHKNKTFFEVQSEHFVTVGILNEIYLTSVQLNQLSQMYIRTEDQYYLNNYTNITNQMLGKSPRSNNNLFHMKVLKLADIIKTNLADKEYTQQLLEMYAELELQHAFQQKAMQALKNDDTSRYEALSVLTSQDYLDSLAVITNTYDTIINNTQHVEPNFSPINFAFIHSLAALLFFFTITFMFIKLRQGYKSSKIKDIDEYIHLLVDSMPFVSIIFNDNGKVIDCNKKLVELLDLSNEEQFINNFRQYLAKEQEEKPLSLFIAEKNELIKEKSISSFKWIFLDASGAPIPCQVTAIYLTYLNKNFYIYYAFNSQKELEMQAKIKEQEERIQVMLDSAPLCCTIWDKDFKLIDCNFESARFFNFQTKQEFIDNFEKLNPIYQPDGQLSTEKHLQLLKKSFQSGYKTFEWLHQDLEHTLIPCHITFTRINYKNTNVIISYTRDLREEKTMFNKLKKKQTELIEAKLKSEREAKAKSDFLAIMSHEIRTPLNIIINVFGLLAEIRIDEKNDDFVQKGLSSATLLLHTINDILDYSKIEAGQLHIEHIPFSLNELIKNIHNLFSLQMEQKGITYIIDKEQEVEDSWLGDPIRITQILNNLINNAYKFTETGSITLKISKISKSDIDDKTIVLLRFEVMDTGIGITEEQIEKIFSPFMQADTSTTRKYGGTGLGLSISKNLASLMEGQLSCTSKVGEGTNFSLEIPLEFNKDKVTTNQESLNEYDENILKNLSILLVEDNPINTLIAAELLKKKKIIVDTASNGLEAIKKIHDQTYDVILMDIQMPDMDGITATKIIRQELKIQTPIIAMTANVLEEDKKLYMQSGFNSHIGKPIVPINLYKTLIEFAPR